MDTEKQPTIATEIERTLKVLEKLDPGSDDYDKCLKHLKSLNEMKRSNRINPEVLLTIGANLTSMLLIMNHERMNVITTKALMFVRRSG